MKRFITLLLLSFIPLMGCDQAKKQDWDDNDTCGENYVSSNPCSNYHQHSSSIIPIYFYWWMMNRRVSPYVSRPVFTSNFRSNSLSRSVRKSTMTNTTTASHSSSRSSRPISRSFGGGRK